MVAIFKVWRLTPLVHQGINIHSKAYQIPLSRVDTHYMSYLPQTIREWNALPPDIPKADTLGTSRSQIDYILVKFVENDIRLKELIQVKILREGHNTSDHYLVSADLCIELRASQKQYRENIRTKINWEKVNKDNYALKVQEVLKDRKYLNIRTPYGIDQATNQILTGLSNALDTCYPRRKSKFIRRKKISWSPKLANAVNKSKKAFFL
ncbi:unnamed protein product [Mytilus coruscus]|uniref:Endonuclease/exonuclease/phosphatase domain-containing protein n=1 Tax=Mytilus coruscus TaxID=42192 RepID=A0A6J8CPK7_MYTCO|nr:unnamed protein product [Mytilus coruscus]